MKLKFKYIKTFLSLIVLCAIFWIGYNKQDDFLRVFTDLKLSTLGIFILLNFLGTLLATARWKILINEYAHISYFKLLKIYLTSISYKLIGFGFMGGDLYRTLDATDEKEFSKVKSTGVTVLDRVVSLMGLLLLGFIFSNLLFLEADTSNRTMYHFILISMFSFLILPILIFAIRFKLKGKTLKFRETVFSLEFFEKLNYKACFFGLLLSVAAHLLAILSFYLVVQGSISEMSFANFLPFGVILFIAEAFPIFGAAHFSSAYLFSSVGVSDGLFIFNDYFICLKIYQVIIGLFLIPQLLKRRGRHE